ncbi:aldo/keto reductase [Xanthomonas oryzae]|uniref:aldo/keto reductase n=1 Tax=Xanthomonas oryzae TaxID=347 RepID=UPI001034448B|nr:aldo/keto reductase [Xanthomonas oryzae]QBH00996.1 aldo/keto reductase [Xanthomonas oryzae]
MAHRHQPRSLDHYRLRGRSGLRVWPLSLGTMIFGEAWGWGADADAGEAKRIFDAYANRGGNVIDTAVNSTNGGSERILGALIRNRRERFNAADVSSSRKGVIASTGHLNARSLEIAEVVGAVADELGASRSQVALAWTLRNPAVVSPMMGARTLQQAEDNVGALEIVLSDEQLARLDAASAVPPIFPERFIGRPMAQQLIYGTHHVQLRT